jgi:hypothetical protein
MDKVLAFDLEIVKEIPEGCKDWKEIRPLGISCASVLSNVRPLSTLFYSGHQGDPQPRAMNKKEIIDLIEFLMAHHNLGTKILTWNGLGFDFDVLAEESGMHEECKELALNHIDMMFHFFCAKGYVLGLDTAAKGLGLGGKMSGMKGDLAPILWASPELKDRLKVLRYVHQDAVTTLEVYEQSIEKKAVHWTSRAGKPNTFWLPRDGWKTVQECLDMRLPDQSWMDKPMSKEDFMTWL